MEKTLILLKPDTIQRGLVGEIISRIENKGLRIVGIKMIQMNDDLLRVHYSHLADKPFFGEICEFINRYPVICLCVEGIDAVEVIRRITGITQSREAQAGTIRGDFGMSVQCNLVHASDSLETAREEIKRFFEESEIFEYPRLLQSVIYAKKELGS